MSALRRDPSRQQAAQKKKAGGPLANEPGFKLGTDLASLQAQQARTQAALDRRGGNARNYQTRLDQINQAISGMQPTPETPPTPTGETPATFEDVTHGANDTLQGTFNQIQNQGPFNPQSYAPSFDAQRQRAEQVAMDSFNRNMAPRFQREEADFRQRMAEMGVPEGSEGYQQQYRDMKEAQNAAYQNAMTGAFQQGQGEQAQAWGQSFQGYQLPLAQLSAMSPYYGAQNAAGMQTGQQNFLAGQNELNRAWQGDQAAQDRALNQWQAKYARGTAWGAPRGGGGGGGALSYDQQLGLLDRQFYNNMVLQGLQGGQQMPLPNAGTGFAQGVGAGIGMGIGSGLR